MKQIVILLMGSLLLGLNVSCASKSAPMPPYVQVMVDDMVQNMRLQNQLAVQRNLNR